jgi:hypothetical protein
MCMSSFIDATGRQALQRTLEFEEELAERFGGSDGEVTASAIRKKYKNQLKQVIFKAIRFKLVTLQAIQSVFCGVQAPQLALSCCFSYESMKHA